MIRANIRISEAQQIADDWSLVSDSIERVRRTLTPPSTERSSDKLVRAKLTNEPLK